LFGEIIDGNVLLNVAGIMIEKWCNDLHQKFHEISIHEYIVMPNHFHVIIENHDKTSVGADLCVCPNDVASTITQGGHTGPPLHTVIQWFKTMTTNEYIRGIKNDGWMPFEKRLWQRNYYEHIIRNYDDYQRIAKYITNNPRTWKDDKLWTN
jgi:REP element-mobilizing transposase RayT